MILNIALIEAISSYHYEGPMLKIDAVDLAYNDQTLTREEFYRHFQSAVHTNRIITNLILTNIEPEDVTGIMQSLPKGNYKLVLKALSRQSIRALVECQLSSDVYISFVAYDELTREATSELVTTQWAGSFAHTFVFNNIPPDAMELLVDDLQPERLQSLHLGREIPSASASLLVRKFPCYMQLSPKLFIQDISQEAAWQVSYLLPHTFIRYLVLNKITSRIVVKALLHNIHATNVDHIALFGLSSEMVELAISCLPKTRIYRLNLYQLDCAAVKSAINAVKKNGITVYYEIGKLPDDSLEFLHSVATAEKLTLSYFRKDLSPAWQWKFNQIIDKQVRPIELIVSEQNQQLKEELKVARQQNESLMNHLRKACDPAAATSAPAKRLRRITWGENTVFSSRPTSPSLSPASKLLSTGMFAQPSQPSQLERRASPDREAFEEVSCAQIESPPIPTPTPSPH